MEREQLNFYLQHCAPEELDTLCAAVEGETNVVIIQRPTSQTLLLPVRDPINGASFISGEILVTSVVTQINGVNGWAMVMDDRPELATAIAILDGAFAAGIFIDRIVTLALRGKENLEHEHRQLNTQVQETKVAFDLL